MPDNPQHRGTPDRDRISLEQDHEPSVWPRSGRRAGSSAGSAERAAGSRRPSSGEELRYWTKTLGVTPDRLREAVKAVGNTATRVREYLSKDGASARR